MPPETRRGLYCSDRGSGRENEGYVALCPELDIASEGETIEEARQNLQEALESFFEVASAEEIRTRLHEEVYITQIEVAVG